MFSLPGYVGWRLLSAFTLPPWGIALGAAVLIAACVVVPMSLRTRAMRDPALADRLSWVGMTAMGFFSSLFVLTVLRDVLLLVVRLISGTRADAWTTPSAIATLSMTFLVTAFGMVI